MLWKTIALLACAAMLAAAAAKPAPKAAPAKTAAAAPKPSSPKPEVVRPAPARAAGFDARNPQTLIDLLAGLGARGEIVRAQDDGVMLKVTSPAGSFQAQFAGCDAHARACAALQFDASADARTATLAEINRFNQSSLACRMIQDNSGKPHVLYSALVSTGETPAQMLGDIDAWRGCIGDFGAFLKDPTGYLASAP
jgi:hypothetical protein